MLSVSGLGVVIDRGNTELRPVDGVDLTIAAGETFALLGESGCGKSMTALALTRLLPDSGRIERGEVRLNGEDLLRLPEAAMRSVRGGRIGMIFQEPSTSLNPVMTVGAQIAEALAQHGLRGARRMPRPAGCSRRSAFPIRHGACATTPSSSPAA